MTRVAVVGHLEWAQFLGVDALPAAGQITPATELSVHAGGGAVVAAAVLAELGAHVDFFCAAGDDDVAAAALADLARRGITVHAARRPGATRRVIVLLDAGAQRSILAIGERLQPAGADPLPWELLDAADGVYFTAGDVGALRAARRARVLTSTPRIAERLDDVRSTLDALIWSADDAVESRWASALAPHARLRVVTDGARGGSWSGESSGRWDVVPAPGPIRDSYGCGDAFAAGFTYGLAAGGSAAQAARVGATCGAEMLTRVGAP